MKKLSISLLSLLCLFGVSGAQAQVACDAAKSAYNVCAQKCFPTDENGNSVVTCDPISECKSELDTLQTCTPSEAENTNTEATGETTATTSANNSGNGSVYNEKIEVSELNTAASPNTNNGPIVDSYQYNAQYNGKPVFDGPGIRGGAREVASRLDRNVSREANLKILIIGWTNFILGIAALMAVVALVWAGFLYITAFGDDSRMETAKKIVIWVVGGILLILGAYAIVNTVMQAVF